MTQIGVQELCFLDPNLEKAAAVDIVRGEGRSGGQTLEEGVHRGTLDDAAGAGVAGRGAEGPGFVSISFRGSGAREVPSM